MPFTISTPIRFAHVDPAGIVFYPRYFELLNAAVEDWFTQRLSRSFRQLHLEDRIGTPTVSLRTEFVSPGRLGDELEISLMPEVGRTSCTVAFTMASSGVTRLHGHAVLVCIDLDSGAARPWPNAVRAAMASDSDHGVA